MIWNPVGILNTYVGISIPHPEGKDVGNDKSTTWERAKNIKKILLYRLECMCGFLAQFHYFFAYSFPNSLWERTLT